MTGPKAFRAVGGAAWAAAAAAVAALAAGCAQVYTPPIGCGLADGAAEVMRAANAAAQRGDWDLAISEYDRARRLDPASHLPLYGLAVAHDGRGGRDAVAIAYYRAYLAALPAGEPQHAELVLTRIDELDGHAASEAARMVRRGREMADLLPQDIWRAAALDRAGTLRRLDGSAEKLRGGSPPRDGNRGVRGQPSALAVAEIESWVELAEGFQRRTPVGNPAGYIRSAGSAGPERAVYDLATAADGLADAIRQMRANERTWQANWRVLYPGPGP